MADLEEIVRRNDAATQEGVDKHLRSEHLLNLYSALSRNPADRFRHDRQLSRIIDELRRMYPAPYRRRAA